MPDEPTGRKEAPGGKQPTSVRLSDDAIRMLRELEQRIGIRKSGVMELAIRAFAKQHGIE